MFCFILSFNECSYNINWYNFQIYYLEIFRYFLFRYFHYIYVYTHFFMFYFDYLKTFFFFMTVLLYNWIYTFTWLFLSVVEMLWYHTFNIISVKLVAFLYSAESSILPDGPGSVGVHGGVRPSGEREDSRQLILDGGGVSLSVHRFNRDAFRGPPDQILWVFPFQLLLGQGSPGLVELHFISVWGGGTEWSGVTLEVKGWRYRCPQKSSGCQRHACLPCSQHVVCIR